jgi:serine/threonine protein kinase
MNSPDETKPSPVEALVSEALDMLEREGPDALERLLAQHPEREKVVRRRLRWLIDSGLATAGAPVSAAPQRLGDFELFEALGHGGMGVVYRARQISLGREVALKLVRPEQLLFPGQRERFRREVAVVASLAHPGIVPIHAVGEELGTPYFAMERVRGASLAQVLDELRDAPPAERTGRDLLDALARLGADPREPESSLFDGAWPQVCVRIVREAAEALEHAHRRGIVHRDVKPSNLMVTRGGRVLWVDFGLASDVDSQVTAADRRLTRTGLRVGTLAYMSPEQLRGERSLDPRSDVFSLGVTLYELLTSRLPFDESSEARRTEGAGLGVPRDLRKLDARISRELETVVQTATALNPAERYASAADLARDLTCVLEGRPIEARAVSPLRLAALWVRRHPAWTLAASLAFVAPLIVAWRESRARAEIAEKNAAIERSAKALGEALEDVTAQRDATEEERARAEHNLQRAHEAVDRMLSRVGGEALVHAPRSELVRRQLLQDALELQTELLAEPATSRGQRARHAATLLRSAAIRAELAEYEAALELLARHREALDALLAEAPDAALELQRAVAEYRTGEVEKLRGALEPARERMNDALARFEALASKAAPSTELRRSRARAQIELADVLAKLRVVEGRGELLSAAVAELEPLSKAPGAAWELRLDLARALHSLGATPHTLVGSVSASRDPATDARWLSSALELLVGLEAERPGQPMVAQREGETRIDLALRLMQQRDLPGAAREYDAAIERFEGLVRDFPSRPMHTDGLASACYNRSLIAAMQEELPRREQMLRRAIALFDELNARAPTAGQLRSHALSCAQLGDALEAGAEARANFERALEIGEPLLEQDRDGSMRRALAWAASKLAGVVLELGDVHACADAAERLANYAPRPVDSVWAASWFVRAAGALEAEGQGADSAAESDSQRAEWRLRALDLLERAASAGSKDAQLRTELADPVFEVFRDEPRYRAILES